MNEMGKKLRKNLDQNSGDKLYEKGEIKVVIFFFMMKIGRKRVKQRMEYFPSVRYLV